MANHIIALINIKGGAGKSTIACCVAAQLSQTKPVTLIDADPQGGASAWHGAGDDLAKVTLIAEPRQQAAELQQAAKDSTVIIDLAGFANPNHDCSLRGYRYRHYPL